MHLKPESNNLRRNAYPWCVSVYDQSGTEDGCLKHKRVCQEVLTLTIHSQTSSRNKQSLHVSVRHVSPQHAIHLYTYTYAFIGTLFYLDCVWNVMAHAQKPDFVFRRNGRVHLNRRGRQFSRLLAAEVCASVVVTLDTPCSEIVWRVLATHSIRQFPLHFPSRASPCSITFQLDSNN